jgi:hypothetical protein
VLAGIEEGYSTIPSQKLLIESFRLGIVPERLVTEWTVGREDEVTYIRNWLELESEGTMVLEGAYGSGKSHLLLYLREKALEMGYAVAYAGFDPSEASAAFPKRTYRKIVRGFKVRFDGETYGFRGFIEQIALRAGDESLGDHFYLGPIIRKIRYGKMRERDWEWLEGRSGVRGNLGSLYDFTTTANIYCNIFSGLGHASSTILGLKGFIILLDEAETTSSLYYSYQYARGLNFFKGLSMVANDDPILLVEKTHRNGGITKGKDTGLIYSGHLPVPYIYQISSFLKVVFSLTPGSLTGLFFRWRDSTPVLPLEDLKPEDLKNIFRNFVRYYCRVYNFRLKGRFQESDLLRLLEPYLNSPVRTFIKGMTELLDFVRFNPYAEAKEIETVSRWN